MFDKSYYVYILASPRNGLLYVGMTNSLPRRLEEHQNGEIEGFTKKFGIHKLVYYEVFEDVLNAIDREKQLKRWTRAKKNALVEKVNPEWADLSERVFREQ
ncbi:MAG: GIY-YIG nuclease family protein [Clostridia bacterium]|nr:GIY-YIG nuclease family protein [Clostridia bacterium]